MTRPYSIPIRQCNFRGLLLLPQSAMHTVALVPGTWLRWTNLDGHDLLCIHDLRGASDPRSTACRYHPASAFSRMELAYMPGQLPGLAPASPHRSNPKQAILVLIDPSGLSLFCGPCQPAPSSTTLPGWRPSSILAGTSRLANIHVAVAAHHLSLWPAAVCTSASASELRRLLCSRPKSVSGFVCQPSVFKKVL